MPSRDFLTKTQRSKRMRLIKARGTKLELRFLQQVAAPIHREGFRYRKHPKGIHGNPDLVFPGKRIAVFIDSSFWHGRNFPALKPKLRSRYWREKIQRNMRRDRQVSRKLRAAGWSVLRFWDSLVLGDPERCRRKLLRSLRRRRCQ